MFCCAFLSSLVCLGFTFNLIGFVSLFLYQIRVYPCGVMMTVLLLFFSRLYRCFNWFLLNSCTTPIIGVRLIERRLQIKFIRCCQFLTLLNKCFPIGWDFAVSNLSYCEEGVIENNMKLRRTMICFGVKDQGN